MLFGAAGAYLGLDELMHARASASWPAVGGTITNAGIERVDRRASLDQPVSMTFAARLAYEFTVEGVGHAGHRIAYGHYDTADERDARKVLARYPVGAAVKVHYMPGNPGESVLEPGTGGVPWLYLALGIVFTLVGLALVVLVPKAIARPR